MPDTKDTPERQPISGLTMAPPELELEADPTAHQKLKRSRARFSLHSLQTLENWFNARRENPYPTEDERVKLVRDSGLTRKQVNTWLANARKCQLGSSDPLSIYLSSGSDDEPAPVEAIRAAAKSYKPPLASSSLQDSSLQWNSYASQSESSMNSGCDQYPEINWHAPPKRGRKKYATSLHSSASSAGMESFGSANDHFQSDLSPQDSSSQILFLPPETSESTSASLSKISQITVIGVDLVRRWVVSVTFCITIQVPPT